MKSLFLVLLSTLFWSGAPATSSVTVRISNLKAVQGKIQLGLYNKADVFPKVGKEYRKILVPVESLNVTYTIDDLPVGDYALAIYHDLNADGTCNLNFLGIPKEPYGFSNNVRPVFKAPSFRDTKFTTSASTARQIDIRLLQ